MSNPPTSDQPTPASPSSSSESSSQPQPQSAGSLKNPTPSPLATTAYPTADGTSTPIIHSPGNMDVLASMAIAGGPAERSQREESGDTGVQDGGGVMEGVEETNAGSRIADKSASHTDGDGSNEVVNANGKGHGTTNGNGNVIQNGDGTRKGNSITSLSTPLVDGHTTSSTSAPLSASTSINKPVFQPESLTLNPESPRSAPSLSSSSHNSISFNNSTNNLIPNTNTHLNNHTHARPPNSVTPSPTVSPRLRSSTPTTSSLPFQNPNASRTPPPLPGQAATTPLINPNAGRTPLPLPGHAATTPLPAGFVPPRPGAGVVSAGSSRSGSPLPLPPPGSLSLAGAKVSFSPGPGPSAPSTPALQLPIATPAPTIPMAPKTIPTSSILNTTILPSASSASVSSFQAGTQNPSANNISSSLLESMTNGNQQPGVVNQEADRLSTTNSASPAAVATPAIPSPSAFQDPISEPARDSTNAGQSAINHQQIPPPPPQTSHSQQQQQPTPTINILNPSPTAPGLTQVLPSAGAREVSPSITASASPLSIPSVSAPASQPTSLADSSPSSQVLIDKTPQAQASSHPDPEMPSSTANPVSGASPTNGGSAQESGSNAASDVSQPQSQVEKDQPGMTPSAVPVPPSLSENENADKTEAEKVIEAGAAPGPQVDPSGNANLTGVGAESAGNLHEPPSSSTNPSRPPASSTATSRAPPRSVVPTIGGGGKSKDVFSGEKSRAMRPVLFDERYLEERQDAICAERGVSRSVNFPLRPSLYADQSVAQILRSIQEKVIRAKDYRIFNTFPRRPPVYPSLSSSSKGKEHSDVMDESDQFHKNKDENENENEDEKVPMWALELVDDPWREYTTMAAESRNAERQARRDRQQRLRDLQDRASMIPDALVAATASASSTPLTGDGDVVMASGSAAARERAGTADVEGRDQSPALGSGTPFETPRADKSKIGPGGTANKPTAKGSNKPGPADGTPAPKPITVIEQQLHTHAVNTAFRSAGTKRYSWLTGGGSAGGPVSVASSPLSSLKKRKKLGRDKMTSSLSLPNDETETTPLRDRTGSGPGDAAEGTATPSKPSGHKRALSQVDGIATPLGKRQKQESESIKAQQDRYYAFTQLEDKILLSDYKTVLQREVARGGPMKALMEKKLEEIMLKMAVEVNDEYQKEVTARGGAVVGARQLA